MSNQLNDIADMFTSLATNHASIGIDNFGRTLEEYLNKSRSINTYIMIMEPIIARLHGSNEAQIYRTYNVGFTIAHHWQPSEYDNQWTLMDACETIAIQMLARIRYYSESYAKNTPDIWQTFDYATVRMEPIYFENDQIVGMSCTFELQEFVSLAFDPDDPAEIWADLP